jgi:hypothetical protein
LNLTGIVDAQQAIKIGKLVGAKILVTGKAFTLDKSVFITAKLIGTETSLVDGIVVKGKQEDDMSDLIMKTAERVAETLQERRLILVARAEPDDHERPPRHAARPDEFRPLDSRKAALTPHPPRQCQRRRSVFFWYRSAANCQHAPSRM